MNFLRSVTSLASNETVQSLVMNAAANYVQNRSNGDSSPTSPIVNAQLNVTSLSIAKLKEMEKVDSLNGCSCFFDRKTDTFHVVLLGNEPLSVWTGKELSQGKRLAQLLDAMVDITLERDNSLRKSLLQKLTEVLNDERSTDWSPVHLASACGFTSALSRICNKDAQVATNHATLSGLLPLHIAVEFSQISAMTILMQNGAAINKGDCNGRTPLHYAAANSDTNALDLLLSSPTQLSVINTVDGNGQSPLFIALRSCHTTIVKRLLAAGASPSPPNGQPVIFALVGMEYNEDVDGCVAALITKHKTSLEGKDSRGATILHTKISKLVLSCVLSHAPPSCLSLLDSNGRTPLMGACGRGDLDSVVCLLAYNADPNEKDKEGNTSLHCAVRYGDASCVKALLLFGADVTMKNIKGEEAISLCKNVEVSHCLRLSTDQPVPGCEEVKMDGLQLFQFEKALKTGSEKKVALVNVLSLDGGGIRGLVLIEILSELERVYGDSLLSRFQWLAGTSTGAMLALAIAKGDTISQAKKLYFRFKDRIFVGRRPYNEKNLEEFFRKFYGPQTTMNTLNKKVLVTTCNGTVCPPAIKLFRTYTPSLSDVEMRRMGYEDPSKTLVWYAARCSSAAPTYFSPMENRWMDGGLVANNPIGELLQDVCTESDAREMQGKPPLHLGVVLSVGTGSGKPQSVDTIQLELPSGISSLLSSLEALKHLKNMLIEQICRADGPPVTRARAWSSSKNAPFFRFTPTFDNEIALDESNNLILVNMMWTTKVYMRTQGQYVKKLCQFLKNTQ